MNSLFHTVTRKSRWSIFKIFKFAGSCPICKYTQIFCVCIYIYIFEIINRSRGLFPESRLGSKSICLTTNVYTRLIVYAIVFAPRTSPWRSIYRVNCSLCLSCPGRIRSHFTKICIAGIGIYFLTRESIIFHWSSAVRVRASEIHLLIKFCCRTLSSRRPTLLYNSFVITTKRENNNNPSNN